MLRWGASPVGMISANGVLWSRGRGTANPVHDPNALFPTFWVKLFWHTRGYKIEIHDPNAVFPRFESYFGVNTQVAFTPPGAKFENIMT